MITANLIPALGWTLLHSLWQGALLFLLISPLFHLLKNRPPQLRYGIACTALLLLLGAMTWTFSTQLEFSSQGLELATIAPSNALPTMESEGAALPVGITSEEFVSSTAASDSTTFSLASFVEANVNYLVAIWGLGVLVFTFRWFNMLLLTLRLRKRGVNSLPPVWQERLLRLKRSMRVDQVIKLVESNQVDTPLVIGYFKPVILLPIGLVNGLSVAQVEAILAHELAHVKRQDFLVNLFLTGLEVILFYHPVYWWLAGRINQEREKCCDDAAVAACGNPRMYARTLLSVEEHRQSGVLAMAFAKEGGQLQNRIQRICRATPRHHHTFSLRLWLLLPLLACVAAFAYAGGTPVNVEDNTSTTPDPISQEGISSLETMGNGTLAEEHTLAIIPAEDLPEPAPERDLEVTPLPVTPLPVTSIDAPEPSNASKVRAPRVGGVPISVTQVAFDSVPDPSIPRLSSDPKLPTPPTFDLSEKEIKSLLGKGDEGRKELRKQTDAYRTKIRDWNDRVSEEYLATWENHRLRIMEAYEEWSKSLRASSGNELAFALAHNSKTELFEEAFNQNENAMEKVEDVIEDNPEFDTEGLEREIERGEKSQGGHHERMEVHSIRMGMHSVRMAIHSGRMRVHSGRMKMHSTRMKLHSERMKSHQVIMAAMEADLREALIADGLLDQDEKYFRFEVTSRDVLFNGKVIEPAAKQQKYRDILARYGKGDMKGNPGNTFMINIHKNGKNVGTHHSRN